MLSSSADKLVQGCEKLRDDLKSMHPDTLDRDTLINLRGRVMHLLDRTAALEASLAFRSAETDRIVEENAIVSTAADEISVLVDHHEPFRLLKNEEMERTDSEEDSRDICGTSLLRIGCSEEDLRALLLRYARYSLGEVSSDDECEDENEASHAARPPLAHDDDDPPFQANPPRHRESAAAPAPARGARLAAEIAAAKAALMAETRRAQEAAAAVRAAALLPAGAAAEAAARAAGIAALQEELVRRRY
jgi:hypothetical protein